MQNAISYDLPTYKPAPPIFPDTLVLLITDLIQGNKTQDLIEQWTLTRC